MKIILRHSILYWLFILQVGAFSYYPGSSDRNLVCLATSEITEHQHLLYRIQHRFAEASPIGESNPAYGLFGLDGSANIYMDLSYGLLNFGELTIGREKTNKTFFLEAKTQIWNQHTDKKPLSITVSANANLRTLRELPDSRRHSFGGSLILDRQLLSDQLNLLLNILGQSNTNLGPAAVDHSAGMGLGIIYRVNRASFFAETLWPISWNDYGYVRSESIGNETLDGQWLQGYGFNYRIYNHSFAMTFSNYADMLAANYLPGAPAGTRRWALWRLGFNLTRTFNLGD